jgi:hypothetical protein
MFKADHLQEKWEPVLNHSEMEPIKDSYRKAVTAVILENQERAIKEERGFLSEAAPVSDTGSMTNYDPILVSLVRRAMPSLIAYDIAGVQPMTGPTGLVFAMRSRFKGNASSDTEAFYNEADSKFSAAGTTANVPGSAGTSSNGQTNPAVLNDSSPGAYTAAAGMTTANAEALGDGSTSGHESFAEMSFSLEKFAVTAKSRALKAEYSMELAQDLKAVHGLDAETELSNILSTEILHEINREVVRTVYVVAKPGAQSDTTNSGIFDLDTDSNGRWSVEKFKGLMFQIERDANVIAQETRRGRGNVIICSSDVASALNAAGQLDYTPALNNSLATDDAGQTFAGVLNGKYKVYIDPYSANASAKQFYVVGYKGSGFADAGLFYCPYVPLQMVRAVGENTFQPKIGFKTRYGMTSNPFAGGSAVRSGALTANDNVYYRRVQVANIM